jgi:alcohol dehydrogenase YqhD (iron-dependent ADH family)
MENFIFHNPTELVFGSVGEERIPNLIKKYGGSTVLLHFGGQSAEKNGLLPKIRKILTSAKIPFTDLGGVVSNPRLDLVKYGVDIAKQKKCDFILAVGGGSVIDSAKAIAMGFYNENFWEDQYVNGQPIEKALPMACVLTIPAAGSEMSPNTVITDEDTNTKLGYGSPLLRCKFSVINPANCKTVPDFHLASGIVDMLGHIIERYFSLTENTELINAMGEAVMRTIVEQGKKTMADRTDMDALAEIVLCGTMAHNDILGIGRIQDWACHKMEHELSAKYDITHGSGLAIMYPAWLKFIQKNGDKKHLAVVERFGRTVLGADGKDAVAETIDKLEEFYITIGMPIRLSDLNINATEEDIAELAARAIKNFNGKSLGQFYKLDKNDVIAIYNLAK